MYRDHKVWPDCIEVLDRLGSLPWGPVTMWNKSSATLVFTGGILRRTWVFSDISVPKYTWGPASETFVIASSPRTRHGFPKAPCQIRMSDIVAEGHSETYRNDDRIEIASGKEDHSIPHTATKCHNCLYSVYTRRLWSELRNEEVSSHLAHSAAIVYTGCCCQVQAQVRSNHGWSMSRCIVTIDLWICDASK